MPFHDQFPESSSESHIFSGTMSLFNVLFQVIILKAPQHLLTFENSCLYGEQVLYIGQLSCWRQLVLQLQATFCGAWQTKVNCIAGNLKSKLKSETFSTSQHHFNAMENSLPFTTFEQLLASVLNIQLRNERVLKWDFGHSVILRCPITQYC